MHRFIDKAIDSVVLAIYSPAQTEQAISIKLFLVF